MVQIFKVFGKEADFNLLFFILPKTVYILNVWEMFLGSVYFKILN